MLKQDLIEKLELVAPALSGNDLVPVLSHFWFLDDLLIAHDGKIAIQTKLKSGFSGAIPNTLASLLKASRAKDVEFIPEKNNELVVKAASSKLKLPFLDAESTKIFTMPKPDPKKALPVEMPAFVAALESCMRSLKEDTSMPDSMGITLISGGTNLDMYATNDATISYAAVKLTKSIPNERVVISGDFCRQLVSLAKLDGPKHLEINEDYALFQSGDTILFGGFIDVRQPLDFDSVIEKSFPKTAQKKVVSIPSKLELILDRAIIITESKTERPKTDITVADGVAKFFSQSEKGEVRDSVQLEAQHPDMTVSVDPRLFRNGYGFFTHMLLTEECLVMSKGSFLYLVSASH